MIKLTELRRPGFLYDSSKLAILGNKISGDISTRTNNRYIIKARVEGETLRLTVFMLNPNTGKYVSPLKNEQELLAGRISTYLNDNGIAHEIVVK